MATSCQPKALTPPEVADHLRVSSDKVLAWIRSGELRAINVAQKLGGRPRYRITADDYAAFVNHRTVVPDVKPLRRRARRDRDVTQYF
jgi:excisionase family DNA binding protein